MEGSHWPRSPARPDRLTNRPTAHDARTWSRSPAPKEATRPHLGCPEPTATPPSAHPARPASDDVARPYLYRPAQLLWPAQLSPTGRATAHPRPGRSGLGGAAGLTHQQLVGGDQLERRPCCDYPARRRRLCDRDIAARLATLPAVRSVQGRKPPRLPAARLGQQSSRGRHDHPVNRQRRQRRHPPRLIMPSTDSGVSAATQPGWPCSSTSKCMCE
jgi:hypothetical protein